MTKTLWTSTKDTDLHCWNAAFKNTLSWLVFPLSTLLSAKEWLRFSPCISHLFSFHFPEWSAYNSPKHLWGLENSRWGRGVSIFSLIHSNDQPFFQLSIVETNQRSQEKGYFSLIAIKFLSSKFNLYIEMKGQTQRNPTTYTPGWLVWKSLKQCWWECRAMETLIHCWWKQLIGRK